MRKCIICLKEKDEKMFYQKILKEVCKECSKAYREFLRTRRKQDLIIERGNFTLTF